LFLVNRERAAPDVLPAIIEAAEDEDEMEEAEV
jgi:hypothetical protein